MVANGYVCVCGILCYLFLLGSTGYVSVVFHVTIFLSVANGDVLVVCYRLPVPLGCRAGSTGPGCRPAGGGASPSAGTRSQHQECTPPQCGQTNWREECNRKHK